MTLMKKTSHYIFEKATILSRLTLKAYLKYVSVKKIYLPYFVQTIGAKAIKESSEFLLEVNFLGNVHWRFNTAVTS